jgi:hypothetical protein
MRFHIFKHSVLDRKFPMSASANETSDMLRDTEYNKGLQEIQARVWPLRAVIGAM